MKTQIYVNEKQKSCMNLLKEIDKVCVENKIDYYLLGDMALSLYRDNAIITNGTIGIHGKDAKRFIDALQNSISGGRIIETPVNNPNLPSLNIRYCDLNTLDCNLSNYKSYLGNCLHINIKIITGKEKNDIKSKIKRKLAAFYVTSNATSTSGKSVKYKVVREGIRIIRHIFGWKNTSKLAFSYFLSSYSEKSDFVKIDKKRYAREVFDKPLEKNLDNLRCSFPTKIEEYLSDTYANWQEKNIVDDGPSAYRAMSAQISWDEFRKKMDDYGFRQYYVELKKYRRENLKFGIYNRKVNGYYALLERTNDRFLLYTQYKDKKDEIISLHQQKNFEELREILDPFVQALEKNYKKKLGLCFDKDIFNITMDLYAHDGQKAKADKLRKLVPAEHWEPIRLKNYKGEYIN